MYVNNIKLFYLVDNDYVWQKLTTKNWKINLLNSKCHSINILRIKVNKI